MDLKMRSMSCRSYQRCCSMGAGKAHLKSSFSSHFGRISTSTPFTSIAHITNSELYLLDTSHVSA